MNDNRYAIVDIETTGGNARGSRMTEIAIVIHDGERVVERWETLINPEQEIPLAIFGLTGITNEMVSEAPVFADIAAQVFQLLEDKIFVAHNVNFDYSFVKHQLEECGYKWSARKLCTVRLARKLRPGIPSYSLGRLCDYLGIPLQGRHRAGGDVDATALLFELLLRSDTQDAVTGMLKKSAPDQRIPPNLNPEEFAGLPDCPGVYYFHDRSGKVIYVGKAINIKKRVASHFTGHNINPQRQHFLRDIHHISYERCATELMALLFECIEIKRLWPAYNRSLKRFEPRYGLIHYQGQNGYSYLAIVKLTKQQPCLWVFHREYDGVRLLQQLMADFAIDYRFCRFGMGQQSIQTAMPPLPDREQHNEVVDRALDHLDEQQPTFMLLDRGRDTDESSCIYVERGHFRAMGYIEAAAQYHNATDLLESLTPYAGNHYMMQLILAYAQKYPAKIRRWNTVAESAVQD